MQPERTVAAVGRGDEAQPAALALGVEVLLLVLRGDARHVRLDPDLQEMGDPVLGVVELAVAHAAARAHALHVAGPDHARRCVLGGTRAHAVLVRELAVEDVADDLHVAVAVRAEAAPRGDAASL